MTTRKELDTFYTVLDSVTVTELAKFKKLIVASLKDSKTELTDKGNLSGNPMFTGLILEAMGITGKSGLSYWFDSQALAEISK
jgi:hypothetical protein